MDVLCKSLGVRHIIVLWRRDTISSIVSLLIAKKTGISILMMIFGSKAFCTF
jgi:hypothetical protein